MRKGIELELKGLLTPRERVWGAIRSLKAGFTRLAVGDSCNPVVTQFAIDLYMADLIAAGYIARASVGKRRPGRGSVAESDSYDLVKDQLEAPRVTTGGKHSSKGMGALAMWRVIRMLPRGFDHHEVARLASMDNFEVKKATAKKYVNVLARAGYFTELQPATGNRPARYRLARNTGPHAPILTVTRGVFDRNTGSFSLAQTAQEVCDGIDE
jgi:hypothetical protein